MNVREWRLAEGLTIKAAAELCGVPQRSWEAWEYGRARPGVVAAQKIIEASKGRVTLEALARTVA
jgi:transcriptional regulator with XRE-family HTH domain